MTIRMTDILHRILLSALLVVGMSACSDRADGPLPEPGGSEPETRSIGFYISIDDSRASEKLSSRATPSDGPYDPAWDFEKYIDFEGKDIKFLFFGSDDKLITEFVPNGISATPGDSVNHSKKYFVLGTLPFEMKKGEKKELKLMILANWQNRTTQKRYPDFTPGMSINEIWNSQYSIFAFGQDNIIPSEKNLIPFYGITNVITLEDKDFTLDTQFTAKIGTVHLLRAIAKVEVILEDETAKKWELEDVWFSRYSNRGYAAPKDVKLQTDYVKGTYVGDYTSTPYLPEASNVAGPLKFKEVEPGKRWIAYVPEFGNNANPANNCDISVKFKDSKFESQSFTFSKYVDGQPTKQLDILRNNWYKFTIKKSDETVDITVEVDVQPFAEVILKPDFGLERDEEGNIIVRDENGEIIKVVTVEGDVLTFAPVEIGNIGEANGVYDNDKLLIALLPDGRHLIYNYTDASRSTCYSIEYYFNRDDKTYLHEERTFLRYDLGDGTTTNPAAWESYETHNYFDNKGRLIKQYRCYNAIPDAVNTVVNLENVYNAEHNSGATQTVFKLIDYKGELYGAKDITYYTKEGIPYYRIKVDSEGNETYVKMDASGNEITE